MLFPDASNYSNYLLTQDEIDTYLTKSSASSSYATKASSTLTDRILDNPALTGIVTFPDGSAISSTTESTAFWNDRTFYNTVTFTDITTDPWTSTTITDYLKSATAASTY